MPKNYGFASFPHFQGFSNFARNVIAKKKKNNPYFMKCCIVSPVVTLQKSTSFHKNTWLLNEKYPVISQMTYFHKIHNNIL